MAPRGAFFRGIEGSAVWTPEGWGGLPGTLGCRQLLLCRRQGFRRILGERFSSCSGARSQRRSFSVSICPWFRHDRTLDRVFQFPDIAGPGMAGQGHQETGGELGGRTVVFPRIAFREVGRQEGQVAAALPQGGGEPKGDHIEAVIEIFAEASLLDLGGQVPVGEGDDPHIPPGWGGCLRGDPRCVPGGRRKQLSLDRQRQLSDFVQHQGTRLPPLQNGPAWPCWHR